MRKTVCFLLIFLFGYLFSACSINKTLYDKPGEKIVLEESADYEPYFTTYILLLAEIDTFKESISINIKAAESSLDRISGHIDYMASKIINDKKSNELLKIKKELSEIFTNVKKGKKNRWLLRRIDFLRKRIKSNYKLQ